ncbi:MAG TPA: 30S ribosomal protein S12 methylthiotransferase RimO [Anaerolineae bacterium]|nr:30S ribosomal protein S12 methylthiotransferase RimO [Anaerolineae bacterium]
MKRNSYYLLSLGCSKNTVDSDSMAQLLNRAGCQAVADADDASILIVNTCGFIGPSREESISALRALAGAKASRQTLIAAGCLSQIWGPRLAREVPGLDGVIGARRWMDIVAFIDRVRATKHPQPLYHLPEAARLVGTDEGGVLRAAVAGASAYIKIADGCRRPCAFCTIPHIKGTAVSRRPESILAEARALSERGMRELILIAQDLTDYGHDLGVRGGLPSLIESMCEAAPGVKWIRLMYAYPGAVSDRLIEVMAARPQVAHYLDLPLQHGHPDTLKRMRRPANVEWVYRTLDKLRAAMPDLAIRTTFIVGYPGETEAEFEGLLKFAADLQFDRVGCFKYSYEPTTPSGRLDGQVPEELKTERYQRLMELQQRISLARNQAQVGRTLDVLVEGRGDGLTLGRSYRDAPEIDGLVILEGEAPIGDVVPVKISGAMTYDLTGTLDARQAAIVAVNTISRPLSQPDNGRRRRRSASRPAP